MITDNTLALLCVASYDPNAKWDHVWTGNDIHVTHIQVDGVDIIVFRGSVDAQDWWLDLDAVPHKHPRLGWCHAGFLKYMDLVFENIMAVVGRNVIFCGHSLGAARASIMTGLFLDHGSQVMARVTFGEPRPAFDRLAEIIAKSGCVSRSYRNGLDPVPEFPVPFWPLFPYRRVTEPLMFEKSPANVIPSEWHNVHLYGAGVPETVILGAPTNIPSPG
jgi:hypothetical protein